MKPIKPSKFIYLGKSNIQNAGRGVFAAKKIPEGTLIEECPIILLPIKDLPYVQQTLLKNYCFKLGNFVQTLAVCLGFGSLYNHSYDPNATYIKHLKEETINFVAIKDIKKNEEITVNYNNGNQYDKTPLWIKEIPPWED